MPEEQETYTTPEGLVVTVIYPRGKHAAQAHATRVLRRLAEQQVDAEMAAERAAREA